MTADQNGMPKCEDCNLDWCGSTCGRHMQEAAFNAAPPKSQGVEDNEWFFRWASRAYGQSVTPMEAIGVIFHHPENPYRDKNPWETNQDAPTRHHPTPAQAHGDYVVRCNKCKGTCVYKKNGQNEIEVFHSCNTPRAAATDGVKG